MSTLWVYRAVTWSLLILTFVFALVIFGVRFWLLPSIPDYREAIAERLSEATQQRITIGALEAHWSGFNLQLKLSDVVVFDRAGAPALKLKRVDNVLSWWSLPYWQPQFDSIEIHNPELTVRRDAKGVVSIAGIVVRDTQDGAGLSDWVLRQDQIIIRDATIGWHDEQRGAPLLELTHVDFRLDNAGRHHRFGLRAVPPQHIAGALDVRGDLAGRTVEDLAQWNGRLFAQLDYADIAAWRTWVEFPVSFPHGAGGVRVWARLKGGDLADITADVELAQVRTTLGSGLPELELNELKGRVGWKALSDGFELTTSKLGMTTSGGLTLQPVDFQLRLYHATERKPGRGELHANALDLEPLAAVADHLPFDPELRKELDLYGPRGSLYDVALKWTGAWPQPQQYSAKLRFVKLGVNAVGRLPGFTGISGRVDADEKSGSLQLNSQGIAAELPRVFREPLKFDVFNAQVAWTLQGAEHEIRLNEISFNNEDLAGGVTGTYKTAQAGRGVIDLNANLTRADARKVGRYLPLLVGERGRKWLDIALLGGTSNDVKLRLKGNLDEFPFAEARSGVFQVVAKLSGFQLAYAPDWPPINNIDGVLSFRGHRMEIAGASGTIFGAKLLRVRVELPDLGVPDPVLGVTGEAEGPTSEFIAFVNQSPVSASIEDFTRDVKARGAGKLSLKLGVPLNRPAETKVAGAYQFFANDLQFEDDALQLEQVNGRLEFTDAAVRAPAITMNMLGGAATLSAATQRDGVTRINLAGRASADYLRRTVTESWAQALQGAADWKAVLTLRRRQADIVIDSSLQGLASSLPAPLAKSAADSMPLHIERRFVNAQQDRVNVTLGQVASAQLHRRKDGAQHSTERGTVSFGGVAGAPERAGVAVTGSLKSLDLDQWMLMLKPSTTAAGASASPPARFELARVDVKLGTLDLFGRRFNDLTITGGERAGIWQSVLVGRELVGEVSWRAQGKGKVTARMKNLVIPQATPRSAPLADKEPLDLPALDIVADHFQVGDKSLGKLEVTAIPEGRDWKLERLRVVNPDATLAIDGVWQGWLTQPRTMVNVRLDVSDIGKLLARLGQPEGVRRGTAKLEGPLSWAGSPTEIDYPTLSGNFIVEANKGQFIKLEPGIGKLLGILSLQSLPRRLTLDFRDIFSDGLAFDQIIGSVKVSRGTATTENFRIQGPAVRILMSGDVDLGAETQRLRVKVFPSFSDGLSIAGALIGGPIAGIASFLVQKALKDPLDQMAAYEYLVTGTWTEPQVAKVERAEPARVEQSQ